MAVNVIFEGFVNEVKTFDWGTVAKISHSQRSKDDATGEWTTTGRDYFDVTLPEGVVVVEDQIVRVEGTLKVGTFEKRDGTTGISMKVRAQEVSEVQRRRDGVEVVRDVLAPAPIAEAVW